MLEIKRRFISYRQCKNMFFSPSDAKRKHNSSFTDRILDLGWSGNLANSKALFSLAPSYVYVKQQTCKICSWVSSQMEYAGAYEVLKVCWAFCIISLSLLHRYRNDHLSYVTAVTQAWTFQHKKKNGQGKSWYCMRFLGMEI